MKPEAKTDNNLSQGYTGVGRALTASWLVLIALLVVFANDLHQWAIAADNPSVQQMAPTTARLLSFAKLTGVAQTRHAVESAVHGLYDNPVMLAQRETLAAANELPGNPGVKTSAPAGEGDTTSQAQPQVKTSGKFAPSRILLVGDSSIEAGLGTKLERRLESYDNITVDRFGLHSTGIARPDYFDWNEKLTELLNDFDPDLVIAYWGDNDCQGLTKKDGSFVAHFNTDEWDAEYGNRIEKIVTQIRDQGSKAVIIGMPIMRSKSFSKRIERLNGVVKAATEKAGGYYLPTWDICADEKGNYMASVDFEGKDRIIRAGDGIHLSNHGAAYVAYRICEVLEDWFSMVQSDNQVLDDDREE